VRVISNYKTDTAIVHIELYILYIHIFCINADTDMYLLMEVR